MLAGKLEIVPLLMVAFAVVDLSSPGDGQSWRLSP